MAAGRPTDYREEYNEQAYKLCLLGATDGELASFFEVSESTINLWKKQHDGFSESVTRGKITADAEVANSFHKRALGYTFDEVTFEKVSSQEKIDEETDETIKDDIYKKKVVVKHLPADPGAALNWLKNRQPAKWRDKTEVVASNTNINYNSSELTADEIKAINKEIESEY